VGPPVQRRQPGLDLGSVLALGTRNGARRKRRPMSTLPTGPAARTDARTGSAGSCRAEGPGPHTASAGSYETNPQTRRSAGWPEDALEGEPASGPSSRAGAPGARGGPGMVAAGPRCGCTDSRPPAEHEGAKKRKKTGRPLQGKVKSRAGRALKPPRAASFGAVSPPFFRHRAPGRGCRVVGGTNPQGSPGRRNELGGARPAGWA